MRAPSFAFLLLFIALFTAPATATPIASRIVAAIEPNDIARITGLVGAVSPDAYVLCVSLETAHYAFTPSHPRWPDFDHAVILDCAVPQRDESRSAGRS